MHTRPATRTADKTVAVVLNWNGAAHTVRCVAALKRARPAPPAILVVDNGSHDGSVERIKAECPGVRLVESGSNLGYAGGNNVGIRAALESGARYVLLINNDVEVDPDCIARLEAALDADKRAGAAGPLLLSPGPERRIWAAGGELAHRENVTRLRGFGQLCNGRYRADEDVDYLPGCAILVRREAFAKIGLLDESFFCYMEDVEFGRRLAAAGFKNRFVADAAAQHDASASTGGGYSPARKYMNAVNSVRFLKRHGTLRGWLGFAVFDVLGLPAALVFATLKGRPAGAFAKARGLVDGFRGILVTPERVERYVRGKR